MPKKSVPHKKPIYSKYRKRPVGDCIGDEFVKRIGASGFLKQPPALCFEVYTLKQAEDAGARWVRVIDKDTGTEYRVSLAKLWRESFELDRGFGKQRGLLLAEWDVVEPLPEPVQLDLFEAADGTHSAAGSMPAT